MNKRRNVILNPAVLNDFAKSGQSNDWRNEESASEKEISPPDQPIALAVGGHVQSSRVRRTWDFLRMSMICVGVFIIAGCDDSIKPSAEFNPRLAVFSVLSAATDTQFVRVATSYNPPNDNPLLNTDDHGLDNAVVTISDGTNTYPFRFTTVDREDSSRYSGPIGVFSAYPFRPQANKEYTLTISSPTYGQVRAKTVVPGSGYIDCFTIAELAQPSSPAYFTRPVIAQFSLHDLAKAQLVRFYVVYTTENPGDNGREHYYEVPTLWRIINDNLDITFKIFPKPTRRTAPLSRRDQTYYLSVSYPYPTYNESIYQIKRRNFNVRFKRAVFYLVQFDEQWYKYYATANLFQDKHAVRVDPPDYTNIQGGMGFFGSFRVDSVVVPLPELIDPYPSPPGRKIALESLQAPLGSAKEH